MTPIKVTCHKCNHEWQYKGKKRPTLRKDKTVTCPNHKCSYKVALAKIKEEIQ